MNIDPSMLGLPKKEEKKAKGGGIIGGLTKALKENQSSAAPAPAPAPAQSPAQTRAAATRPGAQKGDTRTADAYVGLKFFVEIDGLQVGTFDECSAVTMETETYEYSEGGLNTYTHKLPVRTKYANITLKRGIDPHADLYHWYCDCMDWYAEGMNGVHKRKNVTISLYDHKGGNPVLTYSLRNAHPVKWTGPEMKASAGAIAIESLEFAHEGII